MSISSQYILVFRYLTYFFYISKYKNMVRKSKAEIRVIEDIPEATPEP